MLPLFCLRLGFGLLASLLLLTPSQINPRFFRTHFLTALGLAGLALVLLGASAGGPVLVSLGVGLLFCFLGSVAWSLEGNPGGRILIVLATAALGAALVALGEAQTRPISPDLRSYAGVWFVSEDLTSAALLGIALTAMLMGHSYLIAPSMSLTPLRRLLVGLFAALLARAAVAGIALWFWTDRHSLVNLTSAAVLWLPLRWGLGLLLPVLLGAMTWQTMRLRNTQSATGILYIVVVFCFLGELTGQLLLHATGYFL